MEGLTCRSGKHDRSRVREYTYKRKYVTLKNGEKKRYTHEVEVCLSCLKDKRETKKGKA